MQKLDFDEISKVLKTKWQHSSWWDDGDDVMVPNESEYDYVFKNGDHQIIFRIEECFVFPDAENKSQPQYSFELITEYQDKEQGYISFGKNVTLHLDKQKNKIVLEKVDDKNMTMLELYADGRFYIFAALEKDSYQTPISKN